MSKNRNRAMESQRRRIRRKTDPIYRMQINWHHAMHRAVKLHKTLPMPRLPFKE